MNNIKVNEVKIHESWRNMLADEFQREYFFSLKQFLLSEKAKSIIYPPSAEIFSAFNHCPFDQVKVVILGQDPYHGPGQAHGLCFSVPDGIEIPPSLKNIFQELHQDLNISIPSSGNLMRWAEQGVLLLNATLTVRANLAGSHQNKGWEKFTDKIIELLSQQKQHLVFFLWGNYARAKKQLIDTSKHLVLEAAHPSPLSAYKGFFGTRHFSSCNDWLRSKNIQPVEWQI